MKTEMETADDMQMIEELRKMFRRISEIQSELKKMDGGKYLEFREQNAQISELEFYNLRKVIKNEEYQSIDTLELRRSLIKKWEKELKKLTASDIDS